jgi:hypothetical protein
MHATGLVGMLPSAHDTRISNEDRRNAASGIDQELARAACTDLATARDKFADPSFIEICRVLLASLDCSFASGPLAERA